MQTWGEPVPGPPRGSIPAFGAARARLEASPKIGEAVKWNAPSFRTSEFFATFFLRATDSVQLIFHMGAKVRDGSTKGISIPDPEGLLQWVAKERCIVTLGAGKVLAQRRAALQEIVRAWIRQM